MKTSVRVQFPTHRIAYTGFDAQAAKAQARAWKQEGRKTETVTARVTGSKTLKHYTVYVF